MVAIQKRNGNTGITPGSVTEVVSRLRDRFRPDKIIVFGSVARNEMRQNSDLDLLVVMKSKLPSYKRAVPMYLMLQKVRFPMDILVFTPSEVMKWRGATNHIITEAFTHGKVVYDKKD